MPKGSCVPDIADLLGTASIALEYGASEDEAIAALLHEAIEDCGGPTTREAIRHRILTANGSVRLVSAADKIYNARSILKDSGTYGKVRQI